MTGVGRQNADAASLAIAHRLHGAEAQQPNKVRLPRPTAPCLRQHRRRHDRTHAQSEKAGVQSPHTPIAPLTSDECTGVIGIPGIYAD